MIPPRRFPRLLLVLGVGPLASSLLAQSANVAGDEGEPIALSQFEVTADRDRGYASTNAVGGTRFNTALVNIPQSIVVVNQEFMRDLGALNVIDAAQYVSGVSTTAGPGREVFNVRGYQVAVTTDGLPDGSPTGQGLSTPFELVDRVEIIKGPAAVLYGSTSPGGNVNRVTRKPFFRNAGTVSGTIGEGGLYYGMFDVNRSVTTGIGDLAVRVIGSHENYDEYINFEDSQSYFISPALAWRPNERTTFTVVPYYLDRNYHKKFATLFQYRPYNVSGPISFDLPRDADWGAKYARESFDIKRLYAALDHQLRDNWTMRLSAVAKDHDERNNDIIPRELLPDNRTMMRTWRIIRTEGQSKVFAFDSLIDYDLGNTRNKTLFVAQFTTSRTDASTETGRKLSGQNTAAGENANATYSNMPLIDIYNYDANNNVRPDETYISASTQSKGEVLALSLQHQIEMFDGRLVANAGIRYDDTESWAYTFLTTRVTSDGTNDHLTTRAGAVYRALPGLTAFYNYSETFEPQFRVQPDGTGFDPTEGLTHEIGLKSDLMSGRVSGTLSFFTIENRNLLVIDPDPERASAGYFTQSAKDTLDGFELDLHFNLIDNLQLLTSFSDISTETNNGRRVRNVPDRTASLFVSYKFGGSSKLGWTVSGGARYKGSQPADAANVLFFDSVTIWDAFVAYQHSERLRFQVNANNVTDEYYADSSINQNLIFAGPERRIRFTATYSF